MSIFNTAEEHDMAFEHRILRDKFTVCAGEFHSGWKTFELKPKIDNSKEFYCCKIYTYEYLTIHLYGLYKPRWFKGCLSIEDWAAVDKELMKTIKRLKVRELVFPDKTIGCEIYTPLTFYIVSPKEMDILGEKMCSVISCRYQYTED